MSELFDALGIHWKLLVSQGVNFFIALAVLTFFVWRPLIAMINARRKRIEESLMNAETIDQKIKDIDSLKAETIAEADRKAAHVIEVAASKASERAAEIIKKAESQNEELLREGELILMQRRDEQLAKIRNESIGLIREVLRKVVATNPSAIHEALVDEAAKAIKGGLPHNKKI